MHRSYGFTSSSKQVNHFLLRKTLSVNYISINSVLKVSTLLSKRRVRQVMLRKYIEATRTL